MLVRILRSPNPAYHRPVYAVIAADATFLRTRTRKRLLSRLLQVNRFPHYLRVSLVIDVICLV